MGQPISQLLKTETLLQELLSDDRLAGRSLELEEQVAGELEWLVHCLTLSSRDCFQHWVCLGLCSS